MKTRGITEGAMFCALTVILALLSYYIPFLVILTFFIPVPMVLLGKRQGLKVSIIASVSATLLIGLLLGPITALSFGGLLLFVSCSLGYAYEKNYTMFRKIIIGYLGFALVMVLTLVFFQWIMGVNFLTQLLEIIDISSQEVLNMYRSFGTSPEQMALMEETIKDQITTMKLGFPTAALLFPLLFSYSNIAMSNFFLKRLGYQIVPLKPMGQWRMPRSLKYFLLLFVIISLVDSLFKIKLIPEVYLYNIMNLVYFVYFIMGMSFIFAWIDHKKIKSRALKILAFLLGLYTQFLVIMIGVFDTYMDLRKLILRGENKNSGK